MSRFLIIVFLGLLMSNSARSQWLNIYQTEISDFSHTHYPIIGSVFMGKDSGIVITSARVVDSLNASIEIITSITTNGGANWEDHTSSYLQATHVTASDINHIWMLAAPLVYHSINGGVSWQKDSIADPLAGTVSSIYFLDSLHGIAGGGGMSMFRSTDGGTSWRRTHNPETETSTYPISYISFSTPKLGIATTYDIGTWVLRTTDSGTNWKITTDINHGVANRSYGLSYPDPSHAFLCEALYVYHSVDSGLTWQIVGEQQPIGGFLRSIAFVDSLRGIAEGVIGHDTLTLGYTSDGGLHWQRTIIDSDGPPVMTYFRDTLVAFAGATSSIFKLSADRSSVLIESSRDKAEPTLSLDADRCTVSMPVSVTGTVRVVNILGEITKETDSHPGEKIAFIKNTLPRQAFIVAIYGSRCKVFKLWH